MRRLSISAPRADAKSARTAGAPLARARFRETSAARDHHPRPESRRRPRFSASRRLQRIEQLANGIGISMKSAAAMQRWLRASMNRWR